MPSKKPEATTKKSGATKPQCNGAVKETVVVKVTKGETLTYSLTVRGAQPTFTLKDEVANVNLLTDSSTPASTSPNVVYQRTWPLPHDSVAIDTDHELNMIFIDPTTEYKYKVVHNRTGGTTDTLIDCTYKLGSKFHFFPQPLRVLTDK